MSCHRRSPTKIVIYSRQKLCRMHQHFRVLNFSNRSHHGYNPYFLLCILKFRISTYIYTILIYACSFPRLSAAFPFNNSKSRIAVDNVFNGISGIATLITPTPVALPLLEVVNFGSSIGVGVGNSLLVSQELIVHLAI